MAPVWGKKKEKKLIIQKKLVFQDFRFNANRHVIFLAADSALMLKNPIDANE
jgi:hypothetical protein